MGAKRDKVVEGERLESENAGLRRQVEELSRQVEDLSRRNEDLSRQNEELSRRVAELERLIQQWAGAAPTERLDQAYSLKAEEQRQAARVGAKRRRKQRSLRRGRVTTQDKLDRADRIEVVLPEGFQLGECRLAYRRPVWRIEDGRAVLVANEIYPSRGGE